LTFAISPATNNANSAWPFQTTIATVSRTGVAKKL